jgi:hypothetical protein
MFIAGIEEHPAMRQWRFTKRHVKVMTGAA